MRPVSDDQSHDCGGSTDVVLRATLCELGVAHVRRVDLRCFLWDRNHRQDDAGGPGGVVEDALAGQPSIACLEAA